MKKLRLEKENKAKTRELKPRNVKTKKQGNCKGEKNKKQGKCKGGKNKKQGNGKGKKPTKAPKAKQSLRYDDDDDDWECVFYQGPWSKAKQNEIWVQCQKCKRWHMRTVPGKDSANYICHECDNDPKDVYTS
jgi:hypothetical protein